MLKKPTLNTEEINKTLDKMFLFINESIEEVNEQDEYIIVINKDINGIMYYDKLTNNLYYDRNTIGKDLTNEFVNGSSIKSDAIQNVFNVRYPNLEVKTVKSKRLTVL
jgi:hypothetical protein